MFWLPADAPAVVNIIATLPKLGIASLALASFVVSDQRNEAGLAWLRLESGAVLVAEHIEDDALLGVLLPLDTHWSARLVAAERLQRALSGRPAGPVITSQRRDRLKRALRTIDGRRQGASYREVAHAFFGQRRVAGEHWKTSALKAQVARLAALGRRMVERGYRMLLQGRYR